MCNFNRQPRTIYMRQFIVYFIFLVTILVGCNQSQNTDKTTIEDTKSELDTFYLGNKLVHVTKVEKSTFDKLPEFALKSNESEYLLKDSSTVKRTGDTLFFKISDNKKVTLINNNSDNDTYVNYSYGGLISDLNKYLIYATYYEWNNYLLIDPVSGDTTITAGLPIVSPDKKTFICGNCDLLAGFTFNGIELYSNINKPELLSARELTKWGPTNIKWLDNSSLIVECNISDTTNANLQRQEFLKLTWK